MTTPAATVGRDYAVHRFLVRGTDSGYVGFVDGGRLLEWLDMVGFEAAARWSGTYCVTAYVGNLHLERPISVGELVELQAQVIHTGTSSMHILVTVYSSIPAQDTRRSGHNASPCSSSAARSPGGNRSRSCRCTATGRRDSESRYAGRSRRSWRR